MSGQLSWAMVKLDESTSQTDKMLDAGAVNWIEWHKIERLVLANRTDQPVQYVGWNVSPVLGAWP
jgi:hypothetical protein